MIIFYQKTWKYEKSTDLFELTITLIQFSNFEKKTIFQNFLNF